MPEMGIDDFLAEKPKYKSRKKLFLKASWTHSILGPKFSDEKQLKFIVKLLNLLGVMKIMSIFAVKKYKNSRQV